MRRFAGKERVDGLFVQKKAVIEWSANRLGRGALIYVFTYHVKLIILSLSSMKIHNKVMLA